MVAKKGEAVAVVSPAAPQISGKMNEKQTFAYGLFVCVITAIVALAPSFIEAKVDKPSGPQSGSPTAKAGDNSNVNQNTVNIGKAGDVHIYAPPQQQPVSAPYHPKPSSPEQTTPTPPSSAQTTSAPTPAPDKLISVTGVLRTHNDNKEGGQVYLVLRDGANVLWRTPLGGEEEFNDPSELPFAASDLSLDMPGNPQIVIELEERRPRWKNIKWIFNIDVTFVSREGRRIRFVRNDITLDAAGRPDTATVEVAN